METPEPKVLLRAYEGTDESSLIDLWNETMTFDRITSSTFRAKVLLDLNFGAEGLLVAFIGGRLVGFVLSICRKIPQFLDGLQVEKGWITAFGVVPSFRGKGIGSALFSRALERLKALGRKEVSISAYTPNYFIPGVDSINYSTGLRFLEKKGWQVTSTPISMRAETQGLQIPLEVQQRETDLKEEGFNVRLVNSADIPNLLKFIQKHFSWDWVRFCQDYLLEFFGSGLDQVAIFVATQRNNDGKEEVVGYCQQRRERFGPFGVNPNLRSKGIGRILLFKCLLEMAAKGFHCAWFLWTDEKAAKLYSVAGFKKVRQFSILNIEL